MKVSWIWDEIIPNPPRCDLLIVFFVVAVRQIVSLVAQKQEAKPSKYHPCKIF
jgi:hypothetical protein